MKLKTMIRFRMADSIQAHLFAGSNAVPHELFQRKPGKI